MKEPMNKYRDLTKKEKELIKRELLKIHDYKCNFCGVANNQKFYVNTQKESITLDTFSMRWAKFNGIKIKEKSLNPVIKNEYLDALNVDNYYLLCLECRHDYKQKIDKYKKSLIAHHKEELNPELFTGVSTETIDKGRKLLAFFKAHKIIGVTLSTCVDLVVSFDNTNLKK